MTKEEIKKEFFQILNEYTKEVDRITKEAKDSGRWLPGLDSNKGLFKDLQAKTDEKLEYLRAQMSE